MVLKIMGVAVFGVTLVAAVWRWKKHQKADWLFAWLVALAGALVTVTRSL